MNGGAVLGGGGGEAVNRGAVFGGGTVITNIIADEYVQSCLSKVYR